MISFKKITLGDREIIKSFTYSGSRRNCDLNFANIYSWQFLYKTEFALKDDCLLFRFRIGEQLAYMMPVGKEIKRELILDLIEDAKTKGQNLMLAGVCADMVPTLENLMPGCFIFESDRNYADYIYLRKDLAQLSGKRFQSKRNHIHQFRSAYPTYEYKPLAPDLVDDCLRLEEKWYDKHKQEATKALIAERHSMATALAHMGELDIEGGVLLVDGEIAAFTYGAPINDQTFDVCVEKADIDIEGAYTMINYLFVNQLPEHYLYINREEDLGIEGLRKAKLSYHPVTLLEKYIARIL